MNHHFDRSPKPLLARLSYVLGGAALALGANAAQAGADLADLSIEQLMDEPVHSVSRREQKLSDVASAITVLTGDDLRRLGVTNVVDALRFVPGMDVGTINASHTAVSARGFNNLYANKLLVMVDGRSVYTPLFAGTYWDLQQIAIEEIDRIEVIRGPGATVWGSNAVNGVINIVSRSARDTQGLLVEAGGGTVHEATAGGRYGGKIGEHTYYRAFGSYQRDAEGVLSTGQAARDNWQGGRAGFRVDRYADNGDQFTWRADATMANLDDATNHAYNANTLTRWSRTWSARSNIEVQAYFDHTWRDDSTRSTQDTTDFSFQQTLPLGARNDLIWGIGYRHVDVTLDQTLAIASVVDHQLAVQLFSGFVQDDFHVIPDRLTLTAGVKLERNDFTGLEIQPSLRGVFKPSAKQSIWAAASRAVRTPNVIEGSDTVDVFYGEPITGGDGNTYLPTISGNTSLKSEVLFAYELGYRLQASERLHLDVASFYNRYSDIIGISSQPMVFEPGQPFGIAELPWVNGTTGHTWGGEISVTAAPTASWRLTGSYSMLFADMHGSGQSIDTAQVEATSTRHQASVRSSYDFAPRWSLDGDVRFVDRIVGVPAYVTADLRLAWRPGNHWEVALVGQNLIDHTEQAAIPPYAIATESRRGFYLKLTGRF